MAWIDLIIIGSIFFGSILSAYRGDKIKMGRYWLVFLTSTLTFVIGLLIVIVSVELKKNETVKITASKWYMGIVSTILIIIGLIFIWAIWNFIEYDIEAKATMVYLYETNYWMPFRYLFFGAGFFGAGIYLSSHRKIVPKENNSINQDS